MKVRARLLWLLVYGAAFGFVEASVVVYLRALYYPEGFVFPLELPPGTIYRVELVRELCTLLMILAPAMLASAKPWARFGAFAVVFGVWDLVYYLGLWAVLGWPESLMTWDILFLLPRIWAGPVLSAALIAVSLVVAGGLILHRVENGVRPRTRWWVWGLAAMSLGLLLVAFMANHQTVALGAMPDSFPWPLYGAGVILGWAGFVAAFCSGEDTK